MEWPQARYRFSSHPDARNEIEEVMRDAATQRKYDAIKELAMENVDNMSRPHIGTARGLRYFRVRSVRIFFEVRGNTIYILSGFRKTQRRIPYREFEKAERRKESL